MATLSARLVDRELKRKLRCSTSDTHHRYYFLSHEDKVIAQTRISHSERELNDYLLTRMAKQLGVSRSTFIGAIDCRVGRDAFIEEARATFRRNSA